MRSTVIRSPLGTLSRSWEGVNINCNFNACGSILRTGVRIAVTAAALGLCSQAWAFSTWVDTVSLPPGGPVLFEACHEGHMLPPTSFGGGWSCGSRTVTGSEPCVSHADDHVFASADLRDGRLRLTANENGSARAGYGDWLQLFRVVRHLPSGRWHARVCGVRRAGVGQP